MENFDSPPGSDIIGSNSSITPLMISIIGVISASITFLIYHYISIKFCIRPPAVTTTTVDVGALSRGVDKKVLETIPIISYSSTEDQYHLFREDQTECVVCLGELQRGEMVRLLPTCKHAFHVPCIDQWFVAHVSCPICRYPIVAQPVKIKIDTTSSSPQPPPLAPSVRVLLPPRPNNQQSNSGGLLRHCGSLVLPAAAVDRRMRSKRRLITGLKRSLSCDQSSVIVEIERENLTGDCSTSSSTSMKDDDDLETRRLCRIGSVKQSDRVSAKLLKSVSRLCITRSSEILPY